MHKIKLRLNFEWTLKRCCVSATKRKRERSSNKKLKQRLQMINNQKKLFPPLAIDVSLQLMPLIQLKKPLKKRKKKRKKRKKGGIQASSTTCVSNKNSL
jgi:hypothetical protein